MGDDMYKKRLTKRALLMLILSLGSCSNFLETEGEGEKFTIKTVQTDMKPIQGLHISGAAIVAGTTDMNGTAVVTSISADNPDRVCTISDIDGPANGTYQTRVIELTSGEDTKIVSMPAL